MGVFRRPDSPWWYLWLETAPAGRHKEKTQIKIGTTVTQRRESRRLADDLYHQRMRELAAKIHRLPAARVTPTFARYATEYEQSTIPQHRGAERERELLKVLRTHFGAMTLEEIDREAVRTWMVQRAAKVSPRTVNRELDLLKEMLRDAAPKYLEQSPLVGMKRLHAPTPKRRLLLPAEERKLLKAATDPVDRALLVLALDGLVRLSDLLDLKRTDRQGVWLYIADPKGGTAYEVPLSTRAAKALDAIPGDAPYYFQKFRQAKTERDRRARVRTIFAELCHTAHVAYGRKHGGITFHWATRRTGATRLLLKKKIPLSAVQRLGNWKTPDVLLQIYAEADKHDMLKAVGRLPTHSRSKRKSA